MRPDLGPAFLIATEAEAVTGAEGVSLDGLDGIAVDPQGHYGFAEEQLVELHCLLLKRASDYGVLDNYSQVYVWDEMHGPWLIRLPDDFVTKLATYDFGSAKTFAEMWAKACRGLRRSEPPLSWYENTVGQMANLARRAVELNKKMYWQAPSC
jgi:hypothetical protein